MARKEEAKSTPAPASILSRNISTEMRESYLDYAMSVITARALPDVRDGLKPVHRRILFAMQDAGLTASAKTRKSATVVGDVIGKYHPHGDAAVYDSMVKMAQDFTMRYPLIIGQGNFGCFTKDTKVRLADGRNITFGQLVDEEAQGKKNYTFTVKANGRIAIAPVIKPRLTKKKTQIVEVTLDNGERIKCTPDHKFLLKNQTYSEARHLKPGTSLMPLYTRLSVRGDSSLTYMGGYEMVLHPLHNEWELTHHLTDAYNIERLLSEGKELNEQNYEEARLLMYPYGAATTWNTGISKYYSDDIARVAAEIPGNHKVVRVEFLGERQDVYDLTVPKTHNFALSAGVFVHNSIDGDAPAAYRYTEAKMSRLAAEMMKDIDKETVEFRPNYDNTRHEPSVLPAAFPNLLANGTLGIAVGMATNIPPHNLREICNASIYLIENKDATVDDLLQFVQGPDFPTGCIAFNEKDIAHAYATGRGGVVVRGNAEITENKKGDYQIIITSIPFRVNKADLLTKIADLVHEKKLEGIRDIRDESTKDIRVVVDLKGNAHPQTVLNYLYKHTQLEEVFHYNVVALVDGVPQTLSLKALIEYFIAHRKEVVIKRTKFDLAKAEDREHILLGLTKALDHIDKIIALIKRSKDVDDARAGLEKSFGFSERQANAILEMRLQKLAGLERKKIEDELRATQKLIEELKTLLKSEKKLMDTIVRELKDISEKYGDDRRTKIVKKPAKLLSAEDLVADEDTVLVLTEGGYIKRTNPAEYRRQKRGGVGVMDLNTKEEDFVTQFLTASAHCDILFFSNRGKAYQLKMYEVPEGKRATKGKSIMNFLSIEQGEKITSVLAMPQKVKASEGLALVMTTRGGTVKKTAADTFREVRRSGLIAITLDKGDALICARFVRKGDDVVLTTARGQSIRFKEGDVREMGRQAGGVRGIKLGKNDFIVAAGVVPHDAKGADLLVLSLTGYGKKTKLSEYKTQGRGGSGIKTMSITDKTKQLVGAAVIAGDEAGELVAMSQKGTAIRTGLDEIPRLSRATQGVRIMKLRDGDKLASFVVFEQSDAVAA